MFVRVDFLHLSSSQPKLRSKSSRSFSRQLCPSSYLVWQIQRIFLRFSTHLNTHWYRHHYTHCNNSNATEHTLQHTLQQTLYTQYKTQFNTHCTHTTTHAETHATGYKEHTRCDAHYNNDCNTHHNTHGNTQLTHTITQRIIIPHEFVMYLDVYCECVRDIKLPRNHQVAIPASLTQSKRPPTPTLSLELSPSL